MPISRSVLIGLAFLAIPATAQAVTIDVPVGYSEFTFTAADSHWLQIGPNAPIWPRDPALPFTAYTGFYDNYSIEFLDALYQPISETAPYGIEGAYNGFDSIAPNPTQPLFTVPVDTAFFTIYNYLDIFGVRNPDGTVPGFGTLTIFPWTATGLADIAMVSAVPLPPALALFLPGLLFLVGGAQRRVCRFFKRAATSVAVSTT